MPASGTPNEVSTATLRVAQHLREEILSGRLAPGTRVRQEDVARLLGASRLPVREALRILEAEGLTQLEANKGARVAALDREQLVVQYQMRERVEPLALRLSIASLTLEQIRQIADLQDEIEATDHISAFLSLDREFHLLSYAGCRDPDLLAFVTRLWNSTQHYRRAFMLSSGGQRRAIVHAEHRLLIDAIERRDGDDCERFLSGHIRRTRVLLESHPELFETLPA